MYKLYIHLINKLHKLICSLFVYIKNIFFIPILSCQPMEIVYCSVNLCNPISFNSTPYKRKTIKKKTLWLHIDVLMLLSLILHLYLEGAGEREDCGDIVFGSPFQGQSCITNKSSEISEKMGEFGKTKAPHFLYISKLHQAK